MLLNGATSFQSNPAWSQSQETINIWFQLERASGNLQKNFQFVPVPVHVKYPSLDVQYCAIPIFVGVLGARYT